MADWSVTDLHKAKEVPLNGQYILRGYGDVAEGISMGCKQNALIGFGAGSRWGARLGFGDPA